MKTYIGTKQVKAEPMNELAAVEKGYARKNEDNHEWREGYHVQYTNPDGSTYDSWSPKSVFEQAYKCADSFLDRLRIEYADVKERVLKLHTFLMSEEFRDMPKEKKNKLQAQCVAMSAYVEILGQRIDEAKMEQKQQEAAQKMRKSLVGLTDYMKLILADSSHICVKDMSKQPSKAQ